jgi:hypothetical protein
MLLIKKFYEILKRWKPRGQKINKALHQTFLVFKICITDPMLFLGDRGPRVSECGQKII